MPSVPTFLLRARRNLVFASTCALLAGCGGSDGGAEACVELPSSCGPEFNPTFNEVYTRVIEPSCARGTGSVCHAAEGRQGDLDLSDPDVAYGMLLGETRSALVRPGDAACSPLTARLRATDPDLLMPPGQPLRPATLCAIERWIEEGAAR